MVLGVADGIGVLVERGVDVLRACEAVRVSVGLGDGEMAAVLVMSGEGVLVTRRVRTSVRSEFGVSLSVKLTTLVGVPCGRGFDSVGAAAVLVRVEGVDEALRTAAAVRVEGAFASSNRDRLCCS